MVTNAVIITIRNSSSRLPNKPLMKIVHDNRSIDIVIKRAKKIGLPVILATSTDSSDDIFTHIAKEHKIKIFRGSLLNKIKRWNDCFDEYEIENALLVDGDDLAYDFEIANRAIFQLNSKNSDIVIAPENIVCGFFTYAISRNGIKKLYSVVPDESTNTDVITKFIELSNLDFTYLELSDSEMNKNMRLTLDYPEDLEFFRALYSQVDIVESGKYIVKFLEQNSNISEINFQKQNDFLINQKKFNEGIVHGK